MARTEVRENGDIVHYTGRMVPGDRGELVEQIIVEPFGVVSKPEPIRRPAIATIYFIGSEAGPIKIGVTENLKFRLQALRLSSPVALTVLASKSAHRNAERQYHKRFAAHRLHGEWFAPHPDILAEIERLTGHPQASNHSAGSSGAL